MLASKLEGVELSLGAKKGKTPSGNFQFPPVPCIIGVDQSYTRTGISIAVEGQLKKVTSINFKNVTTKTQKRFVLQEKLNKAIDACEKAGFAPYEIAVICERIRTFTQGQDMRPQVIKAHAALLAYIVDTAFVRGIETWSVDTRAWKAAILGTSRPIFEPIEGVSNPQKFGSVRKVIDLGFESSLAIYRHNNTRKVYDDDAADSACIALYGFVNKPRLLREV